MFGNAAGVIDIIERAAAPGGGISCNFGEAALIPELHGEASDVVAIAFEQGCDGGAVYSARHGYGN